MAKAIFAVFLFLVCGRIAAGGEQGEYMTMRGNGGDESAARFNDFHAGGLVEMNTAAGTGFSGTPPGAAAGFMRWKNHCVVQPRKADGKASDPPGEPDFLHVSPYVLRQRPEPGGFFEALGFKGTSKNP